MKLRSVKLRNYRGVVESNVSFSNSGVTVVEGPNEIGKTAIAEGLRLAIELPDSSRHVQVRDVQPVGRDEGPEVEISLSSGEYELTYRKRWLRSPMTTLEVTAPTPESLTGREAHDRLNAILNETLDHELWRALRIEQGMALTLPGFILPSMSRALDRAAGGDLTTDREETLWNRINEEYETYWTPTGQVKRERTTSQQNLGVIRDKVADLKRQIQDIENDADQMSSLIEEASRLSDALKESEERERESVERWEAIDRLRTEVDRLAAIHSAAEAQRDIATGKLQHRQLLISNLESSTKELAHLEAEAEAAAPGLLAATLRREELEGLHKDAEGLAQDARMRLSIAVADREHLRQLIEVGKLKERHARYLAAEESLKQAEAYLESTTVDDLVAKQIEEAYIEDERAQAAVGSAAASLQVTALRDLTLDVAGQTLDLAVNETYTNLVEDEVELIIPDIAKMRLSAGPESKGLADERRKTQETYRGLCESVAVADVQEARRALQERQDTQRKKDEALESIRRELSGLTPEMLLAEVKTLTEKVTSYPRERPDEPPLPPDLDAAQQVEGEMSKLVQDSDENVRVCKATLQAMEAEVHEARMADAGRTAKIEVAQSSKNDAVNQLALDREGDSDEALTAAVAAAHQKETTDRSLLEKAQGQLNEADPESVEAQLNEARQAKDRATDEFQSNRDHQNTLRISLELRGEQGLQSAYDEADSQLNHAQREHELQEARAAAARLLKETFQKHRELAQQRYIEPFKNWIDHLGRIVFDPTFEVELDESLQVTRRIMNGTALEVDQLSTGAREQLGVICRLACAIIVSPEDGGAPVMIDDALGWSDPQRLQTMGAAIATAGKQCQVIVLTCTPGRYSHVDDATVVSL